MKFEYTPMPERIGCWKFMFQIIFYAFAVFLPLFIGAAVLYFMFH